MRHFIQKIIFFTIISIFVFFIIGITVEKIISSNLNKNRFFLQEDWHIIHDKYNEYLFLGNSRTWVHVDAQMITNITKKKSYCLAQDGREAKIFYWKLKTYLKYNKTPKIVFIQFDPFCINGRNDGTFYGKKDFLGYIYHDRLKINNIFESEIGYNQLEEFIPLLRYFQTVGGEKSLIHHLIGNPNQLVSFQYGCELQIKKWQASSNYFYPPPIIERELNLEYVDSIVNLCKFKKIEPVLIYSPQTYTSYKQLSNNVKSQLTTYAQRQNLKFWNFNSQNYNDSTLFYNHMHLNHLGARKFTLQLIDSITSYKLNPTYQASN